MSRLRGSLPTTRDPSRWGDEDDKNMLHEYYCMFEANLFDDAICVDTAKNWKLVEVVQWRV